MTVQSLAPSGEPLPSIGFISKFTPYSKAIHVPNRVRNCKSLQIKGFHPFWRQPHAPAYSLLNSHNGTRRLTLRSNYLLANRYHIGLAIRECENTRRNLAPAKSQPTRRPRASPPLTEQAPAPAPRAAG